MSSRLITISLVLNVALVGVLAWILSHFQPERGESSLPAPGPTIVTNVVKQIAVRKVGSSNFWAALAAGNSPSWSLLESSNYVSYIQNLRSIGCPEETIQDIIIADVAKTYAKKRAALRAQGPAHPFWKSDDAWNKSPEALGLFQQLQALDEEEKALVKGLLGVDLQSEITKFQDSTDLTEQQNYAFLPEDKRQKVAQLQKQFAALEDAVYQQANGIFLNQDKEQLKLLEKQKEQELAKILSPEELEDYQLRVSSTAASLRSQLGGFDTTEEEFRRIFRLQKTFEDQFSNAFDTTDEKQLEIRARAQEDAQQALQDELKKELGEKRFTEYQRAQDSDYRTLVQLSERFESSPEMAAKVYDMRQDAERQKRALENNPKLTPEQREAGLAALAKEAQRAMAQALGGSNSQIWKAYQQTGARQWIANLGVSENPVIPEPEPVETTPAMPNLPPFPPFPPFPIPAK